jgi:alpha-L-fucosidase
MKKTILALIGATILSGACSTSARDLEKIQQEFLSWKFGMFIHFNMSTFVPGGWSTGKEDPLLFNPTEMDFGQWADAAKAAKMKYAILTVKHTGGWCLWDTATSDRDITWFKNYKNGKGDMVKEFTEAFRARGLKVGVYYCFPLWGSDGSWKLYQTLPSDNYAEGTLDARAMIEAQFTELLTNYGDIDVVWVDQSGSPHGGLKEGDWRKIKAHIHSLQPNCLVVANNATDLADSDIFGYEYPYSLELPKPGNQIPTEVCDKLNQGWFANPDGPAVPIRSLDYVVNKMLRPLNDSHANLLLNCSPDKRGLMHEKTVALLQQIGKEWDPAEPSHAGDELYGISRAPVSNVPTTKKEVAIILNPDWSMDELQQAADALAAEHAKATFFVHEATATDQKTALRKWVKAGNELGNGSKSDQVITGMANARLVHAEVNAVQNQLHTIQPPVAFRAPEYQYDDFTWPVLNYVQLTAVEPSNQLVPGSILEVKTLDDLKKLLSKLKAKGLKPVTISELFSSSSSLRLQLAANGGVDAVSGRE